MNINSHLVAAKNLLPMAKHQQSYANCHLRGVYSIFLNDNYRVFITQQNIPELSVFNEENPHIGLSSHLLHDHTFDFTSIPLGGDQTNVIYEHTSHLDPTSQKYCQCIFRSAIGDHGKIHQSPNLEFVNYQHLRVIDNGITQNKSYSMKAEQIHRVVWRGPIIALICLEQKYDRQSYAYMHDRDGIGYMILRDDLYQPIADDKFEHLKNVIDKSIEFALEDE